MSVQHLDALTALSPGADLWIVADLVNSQWSRKIDWYLNFQLLRAEPRQRRELSAELRRVVDEWDYEVPQIEVPDPAPLMVASSDLLPNSQTVLIPVVQDKDSWVQACHKVWVGLGRPNVRIFLPSSVPSRQFEDRYARIWPSEDQTATVEIVTESETLNI